MRTLIALLAAASLAAAPACAAPTDPNGRADTVPGQSDEQVLSAVPDDLALLYLDKKDFDDRLTAAQKASRYAQDLERSEGSADAGLDWLMLSDEQQNEKKLAWFREQAKSRGITVAEVEKYVNLSAYRTLSALQIAGGPELVKIDAPPDPAKLTLPEIEKKISLRSEAAEPIEAKIEELKMPGLKGIMDAPPPEAVEPEIQLKREYVPKSKRSDSKPKKKKKKKKKREAGSFDPIEPAYMRMYELEQPVEDEADEEEDVEEMEYAPVRSRPARAAAPEPDKLAGVNLPPIRLKPIGVEPREEAAQEDRMESSPPAAPGLFAPTVSSRPDLASMRRDRDAELDAPSAEADQPPMRSAFGIPSALTNR